MIEQILVFLFLIVIGSIFLIFRALVFRELHKKNTYVFIIIYNIFMLIVLLKVLLNF
jgi:hypothetical protein